MLFLEDAHRFYWQQECDIAEQLITQYNYYPPFVSGIVVANLSGSEMIQHVIQSLGVRPSLLSTHATWRAALLLKTDS